MATSTVYDQACRVISNFNFEKVRKMMEAVDWRWGGPYMDGEFAVPSIEVMRSQAMSLILEAHRLDSNVSAGGFEAYWIRKGESGSCGYQGEGCIGLRFIADYRY